MNINEAAKEIGAMIATEAANMIDPESTVRELWKLWDKYEDREHEVCGDAATLIELMQGQLKSAIAGQETLQKALAEAQRRERAAVEDISHICRLCVGCDNRESIEPVHRGCPIWQWRGPQAEKGETE